MPLRYSQGNNSSIDLARRTLSSLQAATAGQWIGRQDRRGELERRAFRNPVPNARHLHPLPGRPMQSIDREGAQRQSRSELPARANGRGGPTACGQRHRSGQHERREIRSTRPRPPARSNPAPPCAANPSAGQAKILSACETRQPYPSSCGISFSLRELRRVNNALICHPLSPSPTFSSSSPTELWLKVGDGEVGWHIKALLTRRSSRREKDMPHDEGYGCRVSRTRRIFA